MTLLVLVDESRPFALLPDKKLRRAKGVDGRTEATTRLRPDRRTRRSATAANGAEKRRRLRRIVGGLQPKSRRHDQSSKGSEFVETFRHSEDTGNGAYEAGK